MATYERIDYGSDDGSQWGDSSAKLGMYGATPVTQYADVPAASTYLTTTNTTAVFGFNSLAAVTSLINTVSSMRQALASIGLIV